MSTIVHPVAAHQNAVNAAEMSRQSAIGAAILAGGGSAVVAAATKAADVAFMRAAIASCKLNNQQGSDYRQGLYNLIGVYE